MKRNHSTALAYALAVIMIVFIVSQFLPFYPSGDGSVSLQGYVWFPMDHVETETYLAGQVAGYGINDIVVSATLLPITGLIMVILLLKFQDNQVVLGACGAWSIWAIVSYATNAVLRLGGTAWGLGLGVSILALATALAAILSQVRIHRSVKPQENQVAAAST